MNIEQRDVKDPAAKKNLISEIEPKESEAETVTNKNSSTVIPDYILMKLNSPGPRLFGEIDLKEVSNG